MNTNIEDYVKSLLIDTVNDLQTILAVDKLVYETSMYDRLLTAKYKVSIKKTCIFRILAKLDIASCQIS